MIKNKFFLLLLLLLPTVGRAELTLEVVGGAAQQIPIAVVPFSSQAGSTQLSQDNISNVIGADLRLSGLFRVLETRGVSSQPQTLSEVKYSD